MAESVEAFEFSLQETLKDLSKNGKQIDLKPEQGAAIKSLVHGQDVLAILPTGFGKSAIYQILVGVKEKLMIIGSNVTVGARRECGLFGGVR